MSMDPSLFKPASEFQAMLGYRLVECRAGQASVELDVGSRHLNRSGILHGGVLTTLIDVACGFAGCYSPETGKMRPVLTLTLTTSFTGQVTEGRICATAQLRASGTKIFTSTAEVHDAEGKLIALGEGTFRLRSARTESEPSP